MNHRRYILARFEILRQGKGLKDLFARFQVEELAELQRRRVIPKTVKMQFDTFPQKIPKEAFVH